MRLSALILLSLAPLAAHAEEDVPAPPATASATRLFNHLPYGELEAAALLPVPSLPGCMMAREAVFDVERLLSAARTEGIALGAISCFRSIQHQRRVFCAGAGNCDAVAALRARFVAPPGYSEHATGYAIDFVQKGGDCRAVEQCFALTPGGQWLMRRAPEFGFELSFPAGNKQGVGWEPWHWRWVGASAARARFAPAQASFPALPAVPRADTKTAAGPFVQPPSGETAPGGGNYAVSVSRWGAAILLASSATLRP
ncbi:D-alanyl-D-alanine carboxypeptidase [Sphingomonas kyeonggiensis]|uniref:D-alanyl-D-alanine carboxypeptidase n=1 Tax=Sphingomonas kyeonggiensis TaxID=1268553 RepID=A0A7W7K4U9_9SPHN|nr:M15 family metallopeptidase [Sphingomonas kyeonggiensis]MBB4841013.1 D-alanyl-D-alanine carboxypeptidase [Sphingomonas kyeonggiensis]